MTLNFTFKSIGEQVDSSPKAVRNPGFLVISSPPVDDYNLEVLVIGAARSGTSAIMSAINGLGIVTVGGAPVFEDAQLNREIMAGDGEGIRESTARIVQSSQALKITVAQPLESTFIQLLAGSGLKPRRLVIAARDPFAVTLRGAIASGIPLKGDDFVAKIETTLQATLVLYKAINVFPAKKMFISNECWSKNKQKTIEALADFLDLKPSIELLQTAYDAVQEDPTVYHRYARNNSSEGFLDVAISREISGWARYLYLRTKSAEVELHVNGKLVCTTTANLIREDLEMVGLGNSGFSVKLPFDLKPGDLVSANVVGDPYELNQSPFQVPRPDFEIMDASERRLSK